MNKLVVCYIGQDCEELIKLSLESVKHIADAVVFVDGGSKDGTKSALVKFSDDNRIPLHFIQSFYDQKNKGSNGKARGEFLSFVQKNYNGWWCLVLDPDELLGISEYFEIDGVKHKAAEIKDMLNNDYNGYMVKMRHLIQDAAHEDSTVDEHFAPLRLFKIDDEWFYPEVEHSVLSKKDSKALVAPWRAFTIWHLAYAKSIFGLRERYLEHLAKSNMHTPEFLWDWYLSHITGMYSKKAFNPAELPNCFKRYFMIENIGEELYFRKRLNFQSNHFIDAFHWKEQFSPKKVLSLGEGVGHRVFALDSMGVDVMGIEKSQVAINLCPYKHLVEQGKLCQADITDSSLGFKDFDLVVAYDVLEHINEKDLAQTLKNIYSWGCDNFVFSIPFIGDPNLDADPTHRIKRSKDWWLDRLTEAGFVIYTTPDHFLYKEQVIVCRKPQ